MVGRNAGSQTKEHPCYSQLSVYWKVEDADRKEDSVRV